ncbi:hypothetical protein HK102_004508 [Quaeritorhiza haematococci]|nr:hypothetical protein HK102_004508 [Quaeritorhiza haematococci]
MVTVSGSVFFSANLLDYPDPTHTLCADHVTEATQHNNLRCAVSGFIRHLGYNMLLTYIPALVLQLHLNIVWQRVSMERHYRLVNALLLGSCVGLTIVPAALGLIQASMSMFCGVPAPQSGYWLVYWRTPLIFGSAVLHLSTTAYMIWGSYRSKRRYEWVKAQIRTQWRLMTIALVFITNVIVFLVWYYSIDAASASLSTDAPFVKKWLECLFQNDPNGQDVCAHIVMEHWPAEVLSRVAFTMLYLTGIWVVLIGLTHPFFYKCFLKENFPEFYTRLKESWQKRVRERRRKKKKEVCNSSVVGVAGSTPKLGTAMSASSTVFSKSAGTATFMSQEATYMAGTSPASHSVISADTRPDMGSSRISP